LVQNFQPARLPLLWEDLMKAQVTFHFNVDDIISICIHCYRYTGVSLIKSKKHILKTVRNHFENYGYCLLQTEVPSWDKRLDLTMEEKLFAAWCKEQKWGN